MDRLLMNCANRVRPVFIRIGLIGLCALLLSAHARPQTAEPSGGTKRALLVGINLYQPTGTKAQHPNGCHGGRCDLPQFADLKGPLNDVEAMRDLLSGPKFGFEPENITVLTNPELPKTQLAYNRLAATQTTHDALLAAIEKYLVTTPKAGDTVVFYYAGHGSLRVNSQGTKMAMMVDGKASHADSTLVPADAWTGAYDIRDRELSHIFDKALDKDIKLTVLLDSCHSGSFTRGVELGKPYTERSLGYDPRDINEGPDLLPNKEPKPTPAERKDNPALIFSAAQQDQTAKEREFGDSPSTTSSHGAFTVALIKALQTLPVDAPASDVYRQVRATIEGERVGDQMPALDASKERMSQPLFGGVATGLGETRAAVIATDGDGAVVLDAGKLAGINVGSEFGSLTKNKDGKPAIKLRVESLDGITHARAKVVYPVKANIALGQLFSLSKWVPDEVDTLHFWTWPGTLTEAALQAAIEQVKAAGIVSVEDPVEQPWTDMLAWNGSQWELRHAAQVTKAQLVAQPASIKLLGSTLTSLSLKSALSAKSRLWVNLPPPKDLSSQLALHEKDSLVEGVDDPEKADYLLAGVLTDDGPEWAWFHKPEYLMGPRTVVTRDHSPGCSTSSKYPISSDWVLLEAPSSLPDVSAKLNTYAMRLAKVNAWLTLVGDPSGASTADYYKLVFKRVADKSVVGPDQAVRQDERMKMYLSATSRVSEQRWVYILDIDCHGKGTLLYPTDGAGNRFPNDADTPHEFELSGAPTLKIGEPYGLDSILLISTQEPLPDAYGLNFEGVGTRGGTSRGGSSPLQQLLSTTSGGTRGPIAEMPTNWSIDSYELKSIPLAPK
jgi:hypothetical protein